MVQSRSPKPGSKTQKPKQGLPRKDVADAKPTGMKQSDHSDLNWTELYEKGVESIDPLVQKSQYVAPLGLQVPGNFVLCFLNLSLNRIGEKGMGHLCRAVQCQSDYMNTAEQVVGNGLYCILCYGNPISDDSEIMLELAQVMARRDPSAEYHKGI